MTDILHAYLKCEVYLRFGEKPKIDGKEAVLILKWRWLCVFVKELWIIVRCYVAVILVVDCDFIKYLI